MEETKGGAQMQNQKEALRVRAEYALWSGRKAVYQPRQKELKSKYILEQDDVNRMEMGLSGFLARRKRDYEEKLEKEKAEAAAAKAEWERIDALMREADEKLPTLEEQRKAYQAFWETADVSTLYGEEKLLLDWCRRMERIGRIAMETNGCIVLAYDSMSNVVAMEEESPLPKLKKKAGMVHENVNRFFQEQQMEEKLPSWDAMLFSLYQITPLGTWQYRRYAMENIQIATASHKALLALQKALQDLRIRFTEIWADAEKEGVALLQKLNSGESHACELDETYHQPEAAVPEEEFPSAAEPITPAREGGVFGEVDTVREKERVLMGLRLLKKEFEQILPLADKNGLLNKNIKQDERMDRISGWERALREWQQDLKLYRKNAGNFPCALDGYELLEKKIWQYSEDDGAELRQAYQMHFRDTAERLEQALEQIKAYER